MIWSNTFFKVSTTKTTIPFAAFQVSFYDFPLALIGLLEHVWLSDAMANLVHIWKNLF